VLLAGAVALSAALAARLVLVRRTLRTRVRVELVPSEAFDPKLEAVVRFASQLARTRRMGARLARSPASGVRLQLAVSPDGLMRYSAEVPARALSALQTALGAYDQLDLREPEAVPDETAGAVVRVELVLACVVAGKKSAATLERRVEAVLGLCDADPELRRTPQVEILALPTP
jgi:hypothetical protein